MFPLFMRGILNGSKRHDADQSCTVSPPETEETVVHKAAC